MVPVLAKPEMVIIYKDAALFTNTEPISGVRGVEQMWASKQRAFNGITTQQWNPAFFFHVAKCWNNKVLFAFKPCSNGWHPDRNGL